MAERREVEEKINKNVAPQRSDEQVFIPNFRSDILREMGDSEKRQGGKNDGGREAAERERGRERDRQIHRVNPGQTRRGFDENHGNATK